MARQEEAGQRGGASEERAAARPLAGGAEPAAGSIPATVWVLAIENSADGILVVDGQGTIRYANTAAGELMGRPADDLVGYPFGIPFTGNQRVDIEIPTPAGLRLCEMLGAPTRMSGEDAYVVTLRDVEPRRRITQEKERAVREAEAAARAKDELLNMVAHELRAPLAVISGYLSMLSEGDLGAVPDAWTEPIGQVVENAHELRLMVEQILTAARLEAGRVETGSRLLDLREVLKRAVRRSDGRAALASARVRMELPGKPVTVEADSAQLGTILDNLINNAIKYTDGKPRITVALQHLDGNAEVRVRDNGIGIPADLHSAVFERFRRLPVAPDYGRSGTGLGLAIARELAELNGGVLTIESSVPGDGTCFLLTLPVAEQEAAS